jgi:glycosyltransferase involved in cell wall biosynthesis
MSVHRHQSPVLDVVIPVHNEEGWIQGLLHSLGNPGSSVSICVVLSACSDRSEAICRDWVEQRRDSTRLVVEKTPGVSVARNRGASTGSAPWLLFLDSDVLAPPDLLDSLARACQESSSDLLGLRFRSDSYSLLLRLGTRLSCTYFRALTSFGRPSVPGFAMLVRREAFLRSGGFDVSLAIAEDHDLCDRLAGRGGQVEWLKAPYVAVSGRRFNTNPGDVLLHYIRTEFSRIVFARKYTLGEVSYDFGGHRYPGPRRWPR